MAFLNGYSSAQYVPQAAPASPGEAPGSPAAVNTLVIDGTPVRVVVLALSAAIGLTALKVAGFRFNIGVST